ncbi:hypothetical protein GCM10009740_16310 [Terrabacter terrae]|uniref:SHOCT domain-containing protein n=1 Tax=Terrabacter terrae TaxID=318434 RepID=A0ABN2U2N9_9MICO
MMWSSGMGIGMGLVMAAGTIGFLALVAVLVRALFTDRSVGAEPTGVPSPLNVLADRLARGEITVEEYEQRRRVLAGAAGPLDRPAPWADVASPPSRLSAPDPPDPTRDRHQGT